jgi:4-hydroxy-4-methyl-2-oxoglutarate aldolase
MPEATRWDQRSDSAEIVARYRAIATCQVSDSMGALGLPRRGIDGVEPIDVSSHVAGPAFTVQCIQADVAPDSRIEYLQDIPAGAVVMIANGSRTDCSVWGGQRTLAARQRGAVATVVDGAYRDIPEHLALGYPVFGLRRTVVGSANIANPVAAQQPIEMRGVPVRPGDLVVGDASGVVVVPAEHVVAVLEHAEAGAAAERHVIDEVEAGVDYFEAKRAARDAG